MWGHREWAGDPFRLGGAAPWRGGSILGDSAARAHGDHVSESLDLVGHRLCVRHLSSVLELGLMVLVNLLMGFGLGRRGNVFSYCEDSGQG